MSTTPADWNQLVEYLRSSSIDINLKEAEELTENAIIQSSGLKEPFERSVEYWQRPLSRWLRGLLLYALNPGPPLLERFCRLSPTEALLAVLRDNLSTDSEKAAAVRSFCHQTLSEAYATQMLLRGSLFSTSLSTRWIRLRMPQSILRASDYITKTVLEDGHIAPIVEPGYLDGMFFHLDIDWFSGCDELKFGSEACILLELWIRAD